MPSSPDLLVLLALRLVGVVEVDRLAERVGRPPSTVGAVLDRLAAGGFVRHVEQDPVHGWQLLPEGRRLGERLLADELDATGTREAVEAAYGEFVACNGELLDLCTRWQLKGDPRDGVVNDHTDPDYDRPVVAELRAFDARAQPLAVRLAATLERFGGYAARLTNARRLVEAGERDWFTKPTIDSYHSVWFELHENLLATLGRARAAEEPA